MSDLTRWTGPLGAEPFSFAERAEQPFRFALSEERCPPSPGWHPKGRGWLDAGSFTLDISRPSDEEATDRRRTEP